MKNTKKLVDENHFSNASQFGNDRFRISLVVYSIMGEVKLHALKILQCVIIGSVVKS